MMALVDLLTLSVMGKPHNSDVSAVSTVSAASAVSAVSIVSVVSTLSDVLGDK